MNHVGLRHAAKGSESHTRVPVAADLFRQVARKAAPVAGKESIEVMAGSLLGVMDDFQSFVKEDRMLRKGRQDKGHRVEAAAFLRTIRAN